MTTDQIRSWVPGTKSVQPFHFFASSWHSWRCSESVEDVIEKMNRIEPGMDYMLVYVPLPLEAEYKINHYMPQVEGAVNLGKYTTAAKKGKK